MDPLPGLLHLSNWASILKSSFLFSINPFSIFFNFRDKNTRSVAAATAKSLQSCPTLCDPIDGSLPGSAVLGILQARTLEWVAIAFSAHSLFQPPIYCVCVVSPECLFCLKKENRQFSVSLPNFNNIWRQYDKVDVL